MSLLLREKPARSMVPETRERKVEKRATKCLWVLTSSRTLRLRPIHPRGRQQKVVYKLDRCKVDKAHSRRSLRQTYLLGKLSSTKFPARFRQQGRPQAGTIKTSGTITEIPPQNFCATARASRVCYEITHPCGASYRSTCKQSVRGFPKE